MDIASTLKDLRSQRELSQYKLAKISGVSQSIISSIESGGREPTLSVLARLCTAMGIQLSEFVATAMGENESANKPYASTAVYKLERLDEADKKIVVDLIDSLYSKSHCDKKSAPNAV